MEEWRYKKLHSIENLDFLFLALFVYLLRTSSSQFFSNWKSAEPVFCIEELSCLLYKNQNKSLTLSFWEEKLKFSVLWGLFIKPFFHWVTFTQKKYYHKLSVCPALCDKFSSRHNSPSRFFIYFFLLFVSFNRRWHISTTPNTTKKFCTLFKLTQWSNMVTLSCLAKKNQNLNPRNKKSSV